MWHSMGRAYSIAMWHSIVAQHSHTVHSIKGGLNRRMTHTGSVVVKEMKRFPTRPACVF